MDTITIKCTQCGIVNSVVAGAMLASADNGDLDAQFAAAVAYICAGCEQVVSVALTIRSLLTVLGAGVALLEQVGEDEVPESCLPPHPEDPGDGRPFTPDDVLELHELLADNAWCSALAETPRPACNRDGPDADE